mmetsp:Transcript_51350/g.121997  ORF Transcript_51350/g.121997 Transcript_51350/m.121997 type:complete len:719 (+) Transcript_51350:93-2249(+)
MDLAAIDGLGIPRPAKGVSMRLPEDATGAQNGASQAPAKAKAPEDPLFPSSGLYPGVSLGSSKTFGFLQEWVDVDLAKGGRWHDRVNRKGDVIRTRFPPEPNGYLHIGHAKAITINFGLAKQYGGRCHLRFDDTNPSTEETEFVESIKEDVRWLGYDWGEHCYFASDYFDQLYEWAEHLIKNGKAYVDSETQAEMKAKRPEGVESKFRNRSVEENLKLFHEMRDGKYKSGEHVLRMKGDMKSPNMNMRDMPIYRIQHKHHHRSGNKWCIYPLYDFAHGEEDSIEGITHSICTLEFEGHRELYNWFTANLPIKQRPAQLEMSRLNVTTFLTSKRKLKVLVEQKVVDGWDDPRMSTLSGLRRRGVTPESLTNFILKCGVTRSFGITDVALLEDCIRDDLDPKVFRRMVVLDPLKVVIEDYPEGKTEEVEAANHPSKPELGSRKLKFSREVWIEKSDFREDAPDSYFRLKPGGEVKLRYSYVIKVKDVVKNAAGEVTELRCTHDPATRDSMPSDRKVKGVIHWVSGQHAASHKVRLYDYLILPDGVAAQEAAQEEEGEDEENEEETSGALDEKMKAFLKQVNPNSLIELSDVKFEESMKAVKPMERFQFERNGFFVVDKYSADGACVFNRTIGLKESGLKKDESAVSAARSRKEDQDKQKAEKEAKKKINPRDMFKGQTDLYSKFDEEGVPTHDASGEALNKTRLKKLKAEWEKQKKLFES